METTLLDQVIDTDYGQFDLVWNEGGGFDGDADRFFAHQVNGWVGAATPDGLYICFGRRSGGSRVRIVLTDAPPAIAEEDDDVVEVSTIVPAGSSPYWESWGGMGTGPLPIPSGSYRLRVSARGRDAGAEGEFAEDVVDAYVIVLWPAPPAPDAILRTTSENAAYWHREWGGRRP